MHKFLFFVFLMGISISGFSEEMQFVTTLSSPVGTFSQLETANPEIATVALVVNFCNTRSTTGKILLYGANAYLQQLTLKSGTVLGGNVAEYRIATNGLNVNSGGSIIGGRLMAADVELSGSLSATSEVKNTLYMSSMEVKGAKTSSLIIPSKVATSGMGEDEELHWSDIYKRDYSCSGSSCSEKGSTYTSYLLKTVTAAEPEDPCEDYTYKVGHKSECCPSASQSDSVCYTSCPASYKWQPYKDYTFGVYDGYEYIIGTSALSQSWFGAADWVEKACRQGEFYRTTQGPITCNSAVTSTWCWNPLALNPNFKVVFRAAEHSVNIGQPDTFLGTCSSVGARALLLWGSTYTGYFAEEIMCQFNAHAYNLYANAYYYECINENSGKLCKNGW